MTAALEGACQQAQPQGTPLRCSREHGQSTYLHVPVEADGGEEEALQVLEGDRPLLVLVDGERQGPPGQIQQYSHRGAFRYPTLGSAGARRRSEHLCGLMSLVLPAHGSGHRPQGPMMLNFTAHPGAGP